MDDSLAVLIFIGGLAVGVPLGWFLAQFFSSQRPTESSTQPPTQQRQAVHNKEVWEWVDWTGKKRRIEVHREVE